MPIADEIRTAIEHFAQNLARVGGKMEPHLPNVDFLQQAQLADHLFGRIAGALMPMTEPLHTNPLDDYFTALDQRDALMMTCDHFFTEWDVLICPAGASTAPHHSDTSITINNLVVPEDQRFTLNLATMITPVNGCPTIVMPLGRDQHGLPFGVQLMGRRWNDEYLLAIAAQMSAMIGGFQRPAAL